MVYLGKKNLKVQMDKDKKLTCTNKNIDLIFGL